MHSTKLLPFLQLKDNETTKENGQTVFSEKPGKGKRREVAIDQLGQRSCYV